MTTANANDNETAGDGQALTASELAALEAVAKGQGYPGAKATYIRLAELGLITIKAMSNNCRMLPAGWRALYPEQFTSQPTTSEQEAAPTKEESGYRFSTGQYVRYVGSNREEIPYHTRGQIESLDIHVSDWYGVNFEGVEGVRGVSAWALKPDTQPAEAVALPQHHTEATLRSAWLRHRLSARQNGEEPEDFLDYVFHRLNNEIDRTWEFARVGIGLQDENEALQADLATLRQQLDRQTDLAESLEIENATLRAALEAEQAKSVGGESGK